jgi:hypothetical protein
MTNNNNSIYLVVVRTYFYLITNLEEIKLGELGNNNGFQ